MKSLQVNYFPELNQVKIEEADQLLSKQSFYENIESINWPDLFPLRPISKFIVCRSSEAIFIHFVVHEKQIRALYSNDQDPVWQDSAVEFFCQLPGSKTYFNFEFNCIGACLATERVSRTENIQPLSPDKMAQIKRYASLGTEPFKEIKGDFDWTLTIEIPFSLLGLQTDSLPERLKGNFYKCGDGTSAPHYVSWNPIAIEKPDFHKPEFFGELKM